MTAFYNEIDAYPAAWLRNLIGAGHIAPGVVDERSIVDLQPEELRGYTQAHFFAGIGVWSHALRLAGWADGDGVWTGSCPCQPFSAAGKRGGHADERHLWPAWFRLIRECRPRVVFGEQVASKDGLAWLDAVRADMEGEGYAFGAVDLPAAGVGAPHIRQRAFFVADAEGSNGCVPVRKRGSRQAGAEPRGCGPAGDVGNSDERGCEQAQTVSRCAATVGGVSGPSGAAARREPGSVEHSGDERLEGHAGHERNGNEPGRLGADQAGSVAQAGAPSFWSDAEWVWCRDGVWRPHGPESFPLTVAHGVGESLVRVRSEAYAAAQEVTRYANICQADPREVLQMVRKDVRSWARGKGLPTGMQEQLPSQEVLLAFLLRVASTLKSAADRVGVSETGQEVSGGALLSLRDQAGARGPSPGREPDEQRPEEPSNSVRELSLVLALRAQAYARAKDDADAAPSRVGKLRAYGNCIVAPLAAEFVASFMEANN